MPELREILYSLGQADARALRARAADMDGTAIIREEYKIPEWSPDRDYSRQPLGTPVRDQRQVWKLVQPYNAQHHPQHPAELRAHWSLCHTRDPHRAKPWMDACGQSGLYMAGECYRAENGTVWRCRQDQTQYSAAALPAA